MAGNCVDAETTYITLSTLPLSNAFYRRSNLSGFSVDVRLSWMPIFASAVGILRVLNRVCVWVGNAKDSGEQNPAKPHSSTVDHNAFTEWTGLGSGKLLILFCSEISFVRCVDP